MTKKVWNIDANLRNADWLKTTTWDLPTDKTAFIAHLASINKTVTEFMALPAAEAMPQTLRDALAPDALDDIHDALASLTAALGNEAKTLETKVRHVRNSEYWGMPVNTPIVAGMKPKATIRWVKEDVDGNESSFYSFSAKDKSGETITDLLVSVGKKPDPLTGKRSVNVRDFRAPIKTNHNSTNSVYLPIQISSFDPKLTDQQVLAVITPLLESYVARDNVPDKPFKLNKEDKTSGWEASHWPDTVVIKGEASSAVVSVTTTDPSARLNDVDQRAEIEHRYVSEAVITGNFPKVSKKEKFYGNTQDEAMHAAMEWAYTEYKPILQQDKNVAERKARRIREQFDKQTSGLPLLTSDEPVDVTPADIHPAIPFNEADPSFSGFNVDIFGSEKSEFLKAKVVNDLAEPIVTSLEKTPEGRKWLKEKADSLEQRHAKLYEAEPDGPIARYLARRFGDDKERVRSEYIKLFAMFDSVDKDKSHLLLFSDEEKSRLNDYQQYFLEGEIPATLARYVGGEGEPREDVLDVLVDVSSRTSLENVAARRYTSDTIKNWAETSADSSEQSLALQQLVARAIAPNSYEEHFSSISSDDVIEKDLPFYTAFIDASYKNTQETFKRHGITKLRVFRGMALDQYPQEFDKVKSAIDSEDMRVPMERYEDSVAEIFDKDYALAWIKKVSDNGGARDVDGLNATQMFAKYLIDADALDEEIRSIPTPEIPSATQPATLDLQPLSSWSIQSSVAKGFQEHGNGMPLLLEADIPAERIFSTCLTGNGCYKEAEIVVFGGSYKAVATAVSYQRQIDNTSIHEWIGNIVDDEGVREKALEVALEDEDVYSKTRDVFKQSIDRLKGDNAAVRAHLMSNYTGYSPLVTALLRHHGDHEKYSESPEYLEVQEELEKLSLDARHEYSMFRELGYSPKETIDLLKILYGLVL